jgi:cellulose biosynthesis protein BcsQ
VPGPAGRAGAPDLRSQRLGGDAAAALQLGHADPRASGTPSPLDEADVSRAGGAEGTSGDGAGRVVTVWGPAGAPGRTTVAIGLAAELAASGLSTLLVDADTYGACVAQSLGLLDESPGLLGAARAADRGLLDLAELSRHAPLVADDLRVLTGLARADRWPELRAASFARVLELARSLAAWVVVDAGFCLEQDEELSYDTAAPRRNAATLTALAAADAVVAVGSADPVGLQRLVRALPELAGLTDVPPVVVANRLRAAAVGSSPARRVRDALERYAGVSDPVLVAHDVASLDAAMLAGRTLVEHARSSPVRQGLLDLATRVGATRAGSSLPDGGAGRGGRALAGAH